MSKLGKRRKICARFSLDLFNAILAKTTVQGKPGAPAGVPPNGTVGEVDDPPHIPSQTTTSWTVSARPHSSALRKELTPGDRICKSRVSFW